MGYDGTLKFDTSIDSSGFQNGINKISSCASGALKATAAIIGGAATAVVGIGTAAVKAGATFEASMSKVEAISGATGTELTALTDKAKEMGAKTKFSAAESADAFSYMAMAGWKTADMLSGIEGIMNLAAASGEDLATTSDIVTDALTAFGMQASDASHFADVLARAASNSNTNVGLMGETFKYVAPVAGALGYSAEDCATAIGLMANSGIKASQAGTALRSIFTRMAKPTKEIQGAMDDLGISLTNSDGSMKSLNEIMVDLRKGFAGLTADQKAQMAATLGGQEAMTGLLAIVNASDDDFASLSGSIANCDGAAAEMAETMNDNLQGQITILKSGLEGLGISLYENMETPMKDVVKEAQTMVQELQEAFNDGGLDSLVEKTGEVMAQIVAEVAQAAPKLIETAENLVWSFIQGIVDHSEEIGKSFGEMLGMIGTAVQENTPLIIQAAKDFVAGFCDGLSKEFPGVSALLDGFFQGLLDNAGSAVQGLVDILNDIFALINNQDPATMEAVGRAIANIVTAIVGLNAAKGVAGALSPLLSILKNFKGGVSGLTGIISKAVEGFTLWSGGAGTLGEVIALEFPKLATLGSKISGLASTVVQYLTTTAGGIGTVVTGVILAVTNFVDMFKNGFSVVKDILMGIGIALAAVGAVILGAPAAVAAAVAGIVFAVANLVIAIKQHWDEILSFVSELPGRMAEFLTEAVERVKTWAADLLSVASQAARDAVTAVGDFFAELPYKVGYALGFVIGKLIEFGINAVNWVKTNVPIIINNIVTFFTQLPGRIWTCLVDAYNKLVTWGSNMLASGKQAAINTVNGIVQFFSQLPGRIWNWLIDALNRVANWGNQLAEKGRAGAAMLVNAVVSGVANLPSRMAEVGRNIVHGVWNGISNAAGWFRSQVSSFFSGIVDGAKRALGIHSPSRVFAKEVGKWIPPGVGVGIEDSMPELEKQTDKEMEALADRMQAAVNLETGKISIDKNTSQTYKVDRDGGQSFGDRKTEVVIEGETHVHVDLDGKEIAEVTTPYIDENLGKQYDLEERGV